MCCLWCLEKVLKFINWNAYIMIGKGSHTLSAMSPADEIDIDYFVKFTPGGEKSQNINEVVDVHCEWGQEMICLPLVILTFLCGFQSKIGQSLKINQSRLHCYHLIFNFENSEYFTVAFII